MYSSSFFYYTSLCLFVLLQIVTPSLSSSSSIVSVQSSDAFEQHRRNESFHVHDAANIMSEMVIDKEALNASNISRSLIVGGEDAALNQYPSYGHNAGEKMNCGGTLIHSDIFLTTASCEKDFLSGVYMGGILRSGADSELIGVSYTHVHPEFDPIQFTNDIMFVKLKQRSKKPIQALNLDASIPGDGDIVTTVGFGQLSEDVSMGYPTKLQQVDGLVIPYENCAAFYNTPTSREATQICAGDENGGHGICYGDGGSPLFTTSGTQVGIASYTTGCARPNSYPGYTRISAYGTYIQEMICAMSDDPPVKCAIPASALRKNRCGRSIRCAGQRGKPNFMSKRDIFGQCKYQCVSQSSVNFNRLIGRWKCGQTCFP